MFHLVFDAKGAENLNLAMDLDPSIDGEIVLLTDDYSVGPVKGLFSEEGLNEREQWWSSITEEINFSFRIQSKESDQDLIRKIMERMKEEEFDQIWIWMAPNARDVCGYYWLISQFSAFAGRVYLLSLNNLPFLNEKGNVFYPSLLGEIAPREFIKAKRLARPVSLAEFETDPDEWNRLSAGNKNLRILEGGKKIVLQDDDYYDRQILNLVPPAFQKISRLVHQFQSKSTEKTNERFITWRLKQLVSSGLAELQGDSVRQWAKITAESENGQGDMNR